jgi:hypothetical protein
MSKYDPIIKKVDIIVNDQIFNKATDIIIKKRKEEKEKEEERQKKEYYLKICLEAKICPVCGDLLTSRKATKEEKKLYSFDYFNDTLECEKKHFVHITGEYDIYGNDDD